MGGSLKGENTMYHYHDYIEEHLAKLLTCKSNSMSDKYMFIILKDVNNVNIGTY